MAVGKKTENDWHIDRRITVSHWLTTIILAGAVFGWAAKQDQRLTRVEERNVVAEERLDREISRTANDLSLIRQSLLRMEDRLERAIERKD